jgi:hypothetical protein
MKKVKIMLFAITVLSLTGTAFSIKAKKEDFPLRCLYTAGTQNCGSCPFASLIRAITVEDPEGTCIKTLVPTTTIVGGPLICLSQTICAKGVVLVE